MKSKKEQAARRDELRRILMVPGIGGFVRLGKSRESYDVDKMAHHAGGITLVRIVKSRVPAVTEVRIVGDNPRSLDDGYAMNDHVRSTYAKLTGVTLASLKALIAEKRALDSALDDESKIDRLRQQARALGCRVVEMGR